MTDFVALRRGAWLLTLMALLAATFAAIEPAGAMSVQTPTDRVYILGTQDSGKPYIKLETAPGSGEFTNWIDLNGWMKGGITATTAADGLRLHPRNPRQRQALHQTRRPPPAAASSPTGSTSTAG